MRVKSYCSYSIARVYSSASATSAATVTAATATAAAAATATATATATTTTIISYLISTFYIRSPQIIIFLLFFVIIDQPEFTAHPQNVTKLEGYNVTLSCNATGNPKPAITWTRSGTPINTDSNDSRINFSEYKKQLTIINLNRTDNGEYRCVANNSVGIDTSNAATLNVQCKYGIFCSNVMFGFVLNDYYSHHVYHYLQYRI